MNKMARKSERVIWTVQFLSPTGWRNRLNAYFETRSAARKEKSTCKGSFKYRVARYEMKETA